MRNGSGSATSGLERAYLKAVPEGFPKPVLRHALAARWIPELPSRAVELYWRAHPLRADRLARALARRSGAPQGWGWREERELPDAAGAVSRPALAGPGSCCICGQPVFRFGWHRKLGSGAAPAAANGTRLVSRHGSSGTRRAIRPAS